MPADARSATHDRYDLYELAAQSPLMQARFLRAVHGANPLVLGEDFCGSGAIARAWASLGEDRRAVCVDKDADALGALRSRADQATLARLELVRADVMDAAHKVDVLCALNFPVGYFHDRAGLLAYLRHARSRLNPRGALVVDAYGGRDAFTLGETEQDLPGGVRYVWEQREADPITARVRNAMHFHLPDGATIRDAFVYDWRLWSIPELRDAMRDAGFARVDVYNTLGDAVDARGDLHALPLDSGDDLDDNYVVYVAART